MEDVKDDPFMTHTRAAELRSMPASRTRAVQSVNRTGTTAHDNDPFMTHSTAARGRSGATRRSAAGTTTKNTARNMCTCSEGVMLVLVPWLLFLVIEALFLFAQNKAPTAIWFAPFVSVAFSMVLLSVGFMGRQGVLIVLGTLCLGCSGGGMLLGSYGWDAYMRQYSWMQTGRQYTGVTASARAAAVADASMIKFSSSVVDTTKSIGYVESSLHCVAPILDKTQAAAEVPRIEYWAVGLDCCRRRGAYVCDSAGDFGANDALVAPRGAAPYPGGNEEVFRKAVAQAEAVYNVVSTPQSLLVRWISDPEATQRTLLRNGIILYVTSVLAILIALMLVSCFADARGVLSKDRRGLTTQRRDSPDYRTTV